MHEVLLELKNIFAKQGGIEVLKNINLTIHKGEQWAIVGNSGSGKTSLANVISGKLFCKGRIDSAIRGSIEMVDQQHRFQNLSHTNDFYYQQRFQSQDAEDSLTVFQELQKYSQPEEKESTDLIAALELDNLLDEPLIQLSNGENKRLQIAKALLDNPALLILDNPFTGLDDKGRKRLHIIINTIAAKGLHVLLITSPEEIPESISYIAELNNGEIIFSGKKQLYFHQHRLKKSTPIPEWKNLSSLSIPVENNFSAAVKMVNTTIRYGDKTILQSINWEVKKGEHWSITGPNGAGKSTLLSLISADNPQAYANEIYLFDKRRGTGESIWDIKRKIGMVSPEMHLYFPYTATCFETIASGFFDTIGLFRTLTGEQEEKVHEWIDIVQLKDVAQKTLQQLSMSMQRMVLLARALVKNPPLLILDEPCQGLDTEQIIRFNFLIDEICTRFSTTLLYVSHYQDQLPLCINRRLHLGDGRSIEENRI